MKQVSLAVALAVALGIAGISAAQSAVGVSPQPRGDDDKDVTITGCVVKGDGGYVLTNVAEETAAAATAATPTGTAGSTLPKGSVGPGRVIYLLDDDDDLEDHAGQKVEVEGEVEGDIEKGKISMEREAGMVELEVKVDGEKKVTIKLPDVPAAVGTAGAVGDKEVDVPYVVRKIDVKKVKMIASACQ